MGRVYLYILQDFKKLFLFKFTSFFRFFWVRTQILAVVGHTHNSSEYILTGKSKFFFVGNFAASWSDWLPEQGIQQMEVESPMRRMQAGVSHWPTILARGVHDLATPLSTVGVPGSPGLYWAEQSRGEPSSSLHYLTWAAASPCPGTFSIGCPAQELRSEKHKKDVEDAQIYTSHVYKQTSIFYFMKQTIKKKQSKIQYAI